MQQPVVAQTNNSNTKENDKCPKNIYWNNENSSKNWWQRNEHPYINKTISLHLTMHTKI